MYFYFYYLIYLVLAGACCNVCSIFEEVDEMRFRNTLLEVLEELKMRRQQDAEAEESIASLLESKTTLEHLVEEERRRAEQLQEQIDRQEGEARRSYELQLKELEAERAKVSSSGGVEEREMKALKDEVKVRCSSLYRHLWYRAMLSK